MFLIDTHAHLNQSDFKNDLDEVIGRAKDYGVNRILIPNVDASSISSMLEVCNKYPNTCFPMMGIHPTSVKANFEEELNIVENWLSKKEFVAVGEIGIDLYWDKTFIQEQKIAFAYQINLAKKYDLPINIHVRNSFDESFEVLDSIGGTFKGNFHCFSGNTAQAEKAIEMGFKLGIGGVVTFKNSGLDKVVKHIDLKHIVLETDCPWLAPAPHRGKRNESTYTVLVAEKIAEIKGIPVEEVAEITSKNALSLFNFPQDL